MKTIAIIQARMSSTRLPGKVLKLAAARTLLERMVERVRKATKVDATWVATTIDPSDDELFQFCLEHDIPVYRGSLQDVLDRYYQLAKREGADAVVRLTGDCPLVDPALIDEVIEAFQREHADFACNRLPPPFTRTYPIGLDIEVCTYAALEKAWHYAKEKHQREHVLPYLYETPGRFNIYQLNYKEDLGALRWTVDTPQDLELIRAIYDRFDGRNDFSWLEVLDLYRREPELFKVNASIHHKTMFDVEQKRSQTN
jgi:spore coat polysaccharide biosynthesis protein SpsF